MSFKISNGSVALCKLSLANYRQRSLLDQHVIEDVYHSCRSICCFADSLACSKSSIRAAWLYSVSGTLVITVNLFTDRTKKKSITSIATLSSSVIDRTASNRMGWMYALAA